jgi:hypothetical protein
MRKYRFIVSFLFDYSLPLAEGREKRRLLSDIYQINIIIFKYRFIIVSISIIDWSHQTATSSKETNTPRSGVLLGKKTVAQSAKVISRISRYPELHCYVRTNQPLDLT